MKTALVPVVLDPAANRFPVRTCPIPRPAEYMYEVSNTGTVPLREMSRLRRPCAACDVRRRRRQCGRASSMSTRCGPTSARRLWIATRRTPLPAGAESGLGDQHRTVTGTPSCRTIPRRRRPDQHRHRHCAGSSSSSPSITLTKTAIRRSCATATTVTYTFAVTNTGDVGLESSSVRSTTSAPTDSLRGGDERQRAARRREQRRCCRSRCRDVDLHLRARPSGCPPRRKPPTSTKRSAWASTRSATCTRRTPFRGSDRVLDPAIDLEKSVSDNPGSAGRR